MFASIVIDDGYGGGRSLAEWLQQNGCPCTLVADYTSGFAAITDLQLAGAVLILMFAPVTSASLEFVRSVHEAHPALINGLYTQSPAREHDAALIAEHGLVAVLHHPFINESPARIGLANRGPVTAPAPHPSANGMLQPVPPAGASAGELPPAGIVPDRLKIVSLTDEIAVDRRSSLWITFLEDQPGCCAQLAERLDSRGVSVRVMTSWREAADLAIHAMTPGLIVGPVGDDAMRTGRMLARSASQLVLYSDLPSQVRDPKLRESLGCLAIVKKPFVLDEFKAIVEWMRTPGWQPPHREPVAPGQSTERTQAFRTPPPALTSRLAAMRTPPPGITRIPANQQPHNPPSPAIPAGGPPLTGIAAIRARKQAEMDQAKQPPTGDSARQEVRATGGLIKRQHVVKCSSCGTDLMAPIDRPTALCARCAGQG